MITCGGPTEDLHKYVRKKHVIKLLECKCKLTGERENKRERETKRGSKTADFFIRTTILRPSTNSRRRKPGNKLGMFALITLYHA